MNKDRLFKGFSDFSTLLELAETLLGESEKKSLKQAEQAFLKVKNEKGILLPEQILDLWQDTIDATPGARDALTKKYEMANGLWEVNKARGRMVQ